MGLRVKAVPGICDDGGGVAGGGDDDEKEGEGMDKEWLGSSLGNEIGCMRHRSIVHLGLPCSSRSRPLTTHTHSCSSTRHARTL